MEDSVIVVLVSLDVEGLVYFIVSREPCCFIEVVDLSILDAKCVEVELELGNVTFSWCFHPVGGLGGFHFVEDEGLVVVLAEDVDAPVDFPFFAFDVKVVVCWELSVEDGDIISLSEDVDPVIFKHAPSVEYAEGFDGVFSVMVDVEPHLLWAWVC